MASALEPVLSYSSSFRHLFVVGLGKYSISKVNVYVTSIEYTSCNYNINLHRTTLAAIKVIIIKGRGRMYVEY